MEQQSISLADSNNQQSESEMIGANPTVQETSGSRDQNHEIEEDDDDFDDEFDDDDEDIEPLPPMMPAPPPMLPGRPPDSLENRLNLIARSLRARGQPPRPTPRSAVCIFKIPSFLNNDPPLMANQNRINLFANPQIVGIGPYHHHNVFNFERRKWQFLQKFISKAAETGKDLSFFVGKLWQLERPARACYSFSQNGPYGSYANYGQGKFTEMMLLDGCFIVQLFRHLSSPDAHQVEGYDDDEIFSTPWVIQMLLADLLKLQNQVPFFILERLFDWSKKPDDKFQELPLLALDIFDEILLKPRGIMLTRSRIVKRCKHLLDLIYLNLLPATGRDRENHDHGLDIENENQLGSSYWHTIPSIRVLQLKSSGIKFRPNLKADTFIDIKFKTGVLEIPSITVDEFTGNLFSNCLSWEHYLSDQRPKYFNDYLFFMRRLICQPSDVGSLSSDRIFSATGGMNVTSVYHVFTTIGKNTKGLHGCYLSEVLTEVEAYLNSTSENGTSRSYWRKWISSCTSFSVMAKSLIVVLLVLLTILAALTYFHRSA